MSYYIETEFESPNYFDARNPNETFTKCHVDRCYGIELEFNELSDEDDVAYFVENTVFDGKEDCSTEGGEFVSPILRGDNGFDAIDRACNLANDMDWVADHSNCGMHLHLDMRNESQEDLKKIVLGYYYFAPFFKAIVQSHRIDGCYTRNVRLTRKQITQSEDMVEMVRDRSRYEWLNVTAYRRHKTIEIRLLEGTANASKVKDWINLNLLFVEAMKSLSIGQITYRFGGKNTKQLYKELKHMFGDKGTCLDRFGSTVEREVQTA